MVHVPALCPAFLGGKRPSGAVAPMRPAAVFLLKYKPDACCLECRDATQCHRLGILDSVSQKDPALNALTEICLKLACSVGQISVISLRKFCFFVYIENSKPGLYFFLGMWLYQEGPLFDSTCNQ